MEMEYKDPSRRGRWIVLLGLVLAIGAGAAAFFLINKAQQEAGQTGLKTVTALVAAKPIIAGKPIEAGDVGVRTDIPADQTNGMTDVLLTDPNQAVNLTLAVDLPAGSLVTRNLFRSAEAGGLFSILKPTESVAPDSEAWRAVSINVPDDRAVGGLLSTGMFVDIFLTAQINVPAELQGAATTDASPAPFASQDPLADYYTDQSTKITYQNMQILARQGSFYIIKVPLLVAEEITHLQAIGNTMFSMAQRPAQDTRVLDVSALGETTNRIIERYGLPLPMNYPTRERPFPTNPPIAPLTPPPAQAPAESAAPGASAAPSAAPSAPASTVP